MEKEKVQSLQALSEEELLSQFLPQESAKQLLGKYASLYHVLLHASAKQMEAIQGIGEAKAHKMLCIREVMNRMQAYRTKRLSVIHGPEDVMAYFRSLEDCQQEEMWALLLNTKNGIIKSERITVGTISASLVAPREVFHAAVQNMAAAVIVVHNHPSGVSLPSKEDEAVTKRLLQAGKVMDIPLLDHIIIARQGGCSLREKFQSIWGK